MHIQKPMRKTHKKNNTNKIQEFLHKILKTLKTILEIIIVLKAIFEIIFK